MDLPGFMYVPRKPHPKRNEYHSICCSISGIMFGIELVEGGKSSKTTATCRVSRIGEHCVPFVKTVQTTVCNRKGCDFG